MFLDYIYRIPALLIAITFHEYFHALVAYKMGDPTPKKYNRLTLNPLSHIDPIGLLMLWLIKFGWAKPVPINPNNFKSVKIGTILVAFAGPFINLILAFLSMTFIKIGFSNLEGINPFLQYLYWYNLILAVFNIIPIPPLDGSKIVGMLLPGSYYYVFEYSNIGQAILLVLIFTHIIEKILNPLLLGTHHILNIFSNLIIFKLLYKIIL